MLHLLIKSSMKRTSFLNSLYFFVFFAFAFWTAELTAQKHIAIDNKGTLIEITSSQVSTTAGVTPLNPNEGDVWIDTASNTVKIWEESAAPAWREVASIRNWISLSNSGVYGIDHLVSYNGSIYKNLTGTNSDTTPNLDVTNWKSIGGGDIVPLWKSTTSGGSYATNDIINYNGTLYKNTTGTNSDTTPDLDTTNWINLEQITKVNGEFIREGDLIKAVGLESVTGGTVVFVEGTDPALPNIELAFDGDNETFANLYLSSFSRHNYELPSVLNVSKLELNYSSPADSSNVIIRLLDATDTILEEITPPELLASQGTVKLKYEMNVSGVAKVQIFDPSGSRTNINEISLYTLENSLAIPNVDIGDTLYLEDYGYTTLLSNLDGNVTLRATTINEVPRWVSNTNGGTYNTESIINHQGTLYKNLTGTNSDTTPNLDVTNWKSIGGGDIVPLWKSDSNGGAYSINDIINYNGTLYKNTTGTNSTTTPDADTTNWEATGGGDVVPLWKSNTNSGSYVTNDIINFNGTLYKNLTGTNSDTTPDLDVTNWEQTTFDVINSLTSTSTTDALSANEGRILNNLIQALDVLPESQRNIAYVQLSQTLDIVYAAANAPEPIHFNTEEERLGITHSTSLNNAELTIQTSAIYTIIAQPQVFSGTNNGVFRMWLQRDQGAGFVDVPNSNVELHLSNNGEDVIVFTSVMFLAKDDKVRMMGVVNNTAVILKSTAPVGEPLVPAAILAMFANSTGVNIQKEVLGIVDSSIAPPTSNVDDLYALTNIGSINASWGSIANLEEGDVVVYTGTNWEVVLDASTQFTKGEYQVYNDADDKIYYFDNTEWIVLGSDASDIVPLWKSNTDGGSYATNDIINYNGALYRNKTGTNTDITPNSDTTNWKRPDELIAARTTIGRGLTLRSNWPSVAFNTELDVDGDDSFYTSNPTYRIIEPTTGTDAGQLQIRGTLSSAAGVKRNSVSEYIHARIYSNGNIEFTQDLKTDTFSTAWVNSTNGGVYAANDLTIYSGGIYKNLTGNNTNTTPNVDTTNWSAIVGGSSVDVTGTEQFMGYQINGRDVYQKYVGGTSPTGYANLYLELNGVDTLLSVEGVIKRNNQPQWHSISQIGNDRDGHSGAVYQENDDIAMYAGALLADFQGQPFKIVLKYTK